ncbi:hypothetical protein M3697_16550 [Janibacter melonis]|uniref:hypothetical protein n=1 Tax=Janibacter melonis TaxID=262209 RepID=UPI0020430A11|nr:hypothetical protein [Janibacter melonis]MCM3556698.1 hypothetical protein [Janibacter melonis]
MASPSVWVVIAFWGELFGDVSPWVLVGPFIGGLIGTSWLGPRLAKSRERALREREQSSDD